MTLNELGLLRISTEDTAGAAQVIFGDLMCPGLVYSDFIVQILLNIRSFWQIVASDGLKNTGAIASARAAGIYGLNILEEKIQV